MTLDHEAIRIWCLIYLLRCRVIITPEIIRKQIVYTTSHCVATGKEKPIWWVGMGIRRHVHEKSLFSTTRRDFWRRREATLA